MIRRALVASFVVAGAIGGLWADGAPAVPAAPPSELPLRYTANVFVMGGVGAGVVRLRMTIDRWTTDDERATLLQALKDGGSNALVAAMEKLTVGYAQVDQSLGYPLSVASTWQTPEGRKIRLATNRPISFVEVNQATRSLDYPIGFIELTLPASGAGEGTLVFAAQVQFNADGRLEVTSMPQNTGPQRVVEVQREVVKPKKAKKSKEPTSSTP